MANSNSNRKVVPAAAEASNKFKYEVASDMCVKNIFKSAVRTNVSYGWLMQRANAMFYTYFYISTSYFIFYSMQFYFSLLSFHLIH